MLDADRVQGFDQAVKDRPTVTTSGEPLRELIEGVQLRPATTHSDHPGDLCEIYDERWGFTEGAAPFVYAVTLHPGSIRGWVIHLEQDDRLFFALGTGKVALYDARENSPTFGTVNVFYLGDNNRALLRIPPGVFHAVKNVGHTAALFINLPSRPYQHADPDKYRMPIDAEVVPYQI
jgi:dTDP-4-dehydrorhamnose 3,5-epimerase